MAMISAGGDAMVPFPTKPGDTIARLHGIRLPCIILRHPRQIESKAVYVPLGCCLLDAKVEREKHEQRCNPLPDIIVF